MVILVVEAWLINCKMEVFCAVFGGCMGKTWCRPVGGFHYF